MVTVWFCRNPNHGEDLTVDHKTIINPLHEEGKPQKVIAKQVGCSSTEQTGLTFNPIENIWSIGRRRMRDIRLKNAHSMLCGEAGSNAEGTQTNY